MTEEHLRGGRRLPRPSCLFPLFLLLGAALVASGCLGPLAEDEPGAPAPHRVGPAAEPWLDPPRVDAAPVLEREVRVDGSGWSETFDVAPGVARLLLEATAEPSLVADRGVELVLTDPSGREAWRSEAAKAHVGFGLPVARALVTAQPGRWLLEVSGASAPPQTLRVVVQAIRFSAPPHLPPARSDGPPRSVVAIVDTGVQPYHASFLAAGAADALPAALATAGVRTLPLSAQGSLEERWARDRGLWWQLEPFQVYHVPGTRLLVASVEPFADLDYWPGGHGTGVASIVLQEPDVLVLSVRAAEHDVPRALEWLANLPWVDVINLSWASIALPLAPGASEEVEGLVGASWGAARAGKLLVAAAGNTPTPVAANPYAGPPWVVAAGLWNATRAADPAWDGLLPDVVSDALPFARGDDLEAVEVRAATSYAAPRVSAVLARALHLARAAGSMPSAADLRASLNASATYPQGGFQASPADPLALPLGPLPALQLGWGYVGGSMAAERVAACLLGNCSPPKGAEVTAFMEASAAARSAVWG